MRWPQAIREHHCINTNRLLPGSPALQKKGIESMKIRRKCEAGFTLLEIMIVVTLVGLLATIATPTWVRARTASQISTCINNLRQLEGAKNEWALETKKGPGDTPTFPDISSYLKNAVLCPSDANGTFHTSYNINVLSVKPTCVIVPDTHFIPDTTN